MSLLFPSKVLAHTEGPLHILQINNKFTSPYPLTSISNQEFNLPASIAPENYLLQNAITFEIDKLSLLSYRKNIADSTFTWDFGDGESITQKDPKITHTYQKPGSYILILYSKAPVAASSEQLDSTLIQILPSKDYQIPKAAIAVNQKPYKIGDSLELDFKQGISFDAKNSRSSSEIVEYTWDLGNKVIGKDATFIYEYPQNPYSAHVNLRIKNADGFISDSFIELKDKQLFSDQSERIEAETPVFKGLGLKLAGVAVLLVLGIIIYLKTRTKS